MSEERKSADFSNDNLYRYVLKRSWDDTLPRVCFIGLNPSTADHKKDDPTIRRCRNFAKVWGFGGMWMVNLFAFRATKPSVMKEADDPVGELNDWYIDYAKRHCEKMVACWGAQGEYKNRDKIVLSSLEEYYYIKMTQTGHPSHPLYLKKNLNLKKYKAKK